MRLRALAATLDAVATRSATSRAPSAMPLRVLVAAATAALATAYCGPGSEDDDLGCNECPPGSYQPYW
jgi:hypothetical protein